MSIGSRRRPARPAAWRGARPAPGQHGIGGVGLGLVGEVDAGHRAVKHPAREHRHVDVGRLRLAGQAGHRTRLDRDDVERAVAVLEAVAGEAAEAVERRRAAVAVHVGEAPVRVGLPGLEQEVGIGMPAPS